MQLEGKATSLANQLHAAKEQARELTREKAASQAELKEV